MITYQRCEKCCDVTAHSKDGQCVWHTKKDKKGIDMETIKIEDENGKVYEFEKPIFNDIIDVKLLKVVPLSDCDELKSEIRESYDIVGYVLAKDRVIPFTWDAKTGRCENDEFNLEPIKPKWYEDKNNYPARVVGLSRNACGTHYTVVRLDSFGFLRVENSNVSLNPRNVRLATKEELPSLHYEGKENENS